MDWKEKLEQLEKAIDRLDPSETHSYRTAVDKMSQEWINSEVDPVWFLKFNDGDPEKAARRLMKYWNLRLEVFGSERYYRRMEDLSGKGVLEDEMLRFLDCGVVYLVPPDEHGNMVLFTLYSNAPKFNKTTGGSLDKKNKGIFYMYHLLSKFDRSRQPGFRWVQLILAKQHKPSPGTLQFLQRAATECFPITFRGIHLVAAPWIPLKSRPRFRGQALPYMWELFKSTFDSTKKRSVDYIETDRSAVTNKANIASVLINRIGLRPNGLPKEAGGDWTYERFRQAEDLHIYAELTEAKAVEETRSDREPLNLLAEAANLVTLHHVYKE